MHELREIIKAYDVAKQSGKLCVLATVVQLEGSSYRRPGARMLVLESGIMIGAISGGCLEGDALKKALLTFTEKNARLVTYDTSDEDDASVGVQLGCEGIIQVLFEFINFEDTRNPIELLRNAISKRQSCVIVTLFNLSDKKNNQIGTTLFQGMDGEIISSLEFANLIQDDINVVFHKKESSLVTLLLSNGLVSGFIEYRQPSISMVVVGAGNDAIPMMQMGDILGWDVKIVDGRNTHAKVDRFINACQVLVSKPEKVLEQIEIDDRTCFVLMTHNYKYDLAMLKALINTNVIYIGVLGPKKKMKKMLDEITADGIVINEQMLSRIYGPMGLEIGAETAEEIASSIVAEIQAVFNKKEGKMLKLKQDLIHS
jgi:xanthine/CO dehydrogenase XdhC/CoxF family maturation factor